MLLISLARTGSWVSRFLAFAFIIDSVGCAETPQSRCVVDLPIYDSRGNQLQNFEILRVTPEGKPEANLLSAEYVAYGLTAKGTQLYFPEELIGKRRLQIALRNRGGVSVTRQVALMSCQQRVSIEHGMTDTGAEVSTTTVTGRVTGCKPDSNWWIRAVPMFGGSEGVPLHEGIIRPDGSYQITSGFDGERHVFIIGNGKTVLNAFGLDIVRGGRNDAGTINLGGVCR